MTNAASNASFEHPSARMLKNSMEKRYQIFVSSTYADLKDERQKVIQALMEMDCIPSGMELFPAADEDQFEFIKRVIDDCDYYLLIIGGRYGSISTDGTSYTEKEYEYALSRGIKVLALLHNDPNQIPLGKSENSEVLRERLRAFRSKVETGRLVRYWGTANELPGLVALSLAKTIRTYPAIGWIRANQVAKADVLGEINELRKENQNLRAEILKQSAGRPEITNLAGLDEDVKIAVAYKIFVSGHQSPREVSVEITWRDIFALVAPHLIPHPSDLVVSMQLSRDIFSKAGINGNSPSIADQDFQTVKIQLKALGLVNVDYTQTIQGGMGLFWSLTPAGNALMLDLRTVRTKG